MSGHPVAVELKEFERAKGLVVSESSIHLHNNIKCLTQTRSRRRRPRSSIGLGPDLFLVSFGLP